jgi:hypothetical protein
MLRFHKKRSRKIIGGMAQSRDRVEPTPSCRGYRHLLRKQDVLGFIELMPNWNELAEGLDAIVLAQGESGLEGWYTEGVVGICAWERDLWRRHMKAYLDASGSIASGVAKGCSASSPRTRRGPSSCSTS